MASQCCKNHPNANPQTDEAISFILKVALFTRRITVESDKLNLGFVKQLAISFVNEIFFEKPYPVDTFIGSYLQTHYAYNLDLLKDSVVLMISNKDQESLSSFNSVSDIKHGCHVVIEFSPKVTLFQTIADNNNHFEATETLGPSDQARNENLLEVGGPIIKKKSASNLLNLIHSFKLIGNPVNNHEQPQEIEATKDQRLKTRMGGMLDPFLSQFNRLKDVQHPTTISDEKPQSDRLDVRNNHKSNSHQNLYSKFCDVILGHGENDTCSKPDPTDIPSSEHIGPESTHENAKKFVEKNPFGSRSESIRLHRLQPSFKQVKMYDPCNCIVDGWLMHNTSTDNQPKLHYWRMDEADLTLYESETSTRFSKSLRLDRIKRVIPILSLQDISRQEDLTAQLESLKLESKLHDNLTLINSVFAFELSNGLMYLALVKDKGTANIWVNNLKSAVETNSKKFLQVKNDDTLPKDTRDDLDLIDMRFEDDFPVEQDSGELKSDANGNSKASDLPIVIDRRSQKNGKSNRINSRNNARPLIGQLESRNNLEDDRFRNRARIRITLDPEEVSNHMILNKYLIERDREGGKGFEILGEGQFGRVYAAICHPKRENEDGSLWSGVPVAIKEVSKIRFGLIQQEKVKNEAEILSRLHHQGVIFLQGFHELPDKVYIVMEQLEEDMLVMIKTSENERLTERVTKFLIFQIIEALKYLHRMNIVHCDLKPENVLLVEKRALFPQIKLCDFGFAKIIENNSFRSSLIGTPAYLAPEVIEGTQYNKSVDLWSVGVITYVSLSGVFPFHNKKSIQHQMSRADLYPTDPWIEISSEATDFIGKLLRIEKEERLSANSAQMDVWFHDYQLWCDLTELEKNVGARWVTDDSDYNRWSKYAEAKKLPLPVSARLLHEEFERSLNGVSPQNSSKQ